MTEGHLGRLLSASLHQAIGDELPQRIEFYENWLHWEGLRDGSIGMAPMSAVVGFLRTEGDAYERVVWRAGGLCAEWAIASLTPVEKRAMGWLPRMLRLKAALRVANATALAVRAQSQLVRRVRGPVARVQVVDSLFCASREVHTRPLCGFYGALVGRTLALCEVDAVVQLETCRAVDGSACVVRVELASAAPEPVPALSA